jgi:hypothetical protein
LNVILSGLYVLAQAHQKMDSISDDLRQTNFRPHRDSTGRDLRISAMVRQLSGQLDRTEPRFRERVIRPHIKRILDGVKAGFASYDLAIMFVLLADFVLESAALQIFVERFVGDQGFFLRHQVPHG